MNKKRNIVVLVLVLIAVAVVVWVYVFRKSEASVASEKADYEINAAELLTAFETNELTANTSYLGKILSVTGMVESITEDSVGIMVYLKESDAVSGVICSFDKQSLDLSKITQGKTSRIKGICTGYLMDVVMNKCSLEQ
jgi:hypothetical protein